MAVYQVRLVNQALNLDHTISVPDDQYILDVFEEAGFRLPAGCREGTCSSCVAKVVSGEVDQSEQKFLQPSEIQAGYTVTCVAYPVSDCTLGVSEKRCGEIIKQTRRRGDAETRRTQIPRQISFTRTLETHQEQVLYKSSLYFKSDHANNN
ncbi:MAG: 2Fe-2S iron-sulfur cluster binding domain-containing protein [Symploca sp. SIO2E9]|nr:2Fe-2S iron-sulfur cluster binding domain-containing protein [Symploca sp. SIO2E9]